MKMKIFLLSLWIAIFILVACGSKQNETDASTAQSNVPKENVFSAQENALRKAQQLNQTVLEHDKEMRKKIDEATQ